MDNDVKKNITGEGESKIS